jgi:Fe2+ transport system protein B
VRAQFFNSNKSAAEIMEDNTNILETLIEKATDYGKTSYELAKLKALDTTSEVISSLLSNAIVLIIISMFLLFLNLGLAIWIGQSLKEIYYGFFVVAGFYGITSILVYFFLRKWLKKLFGDSFIKQVLKQTSWNQ